VSPFPFVSLCSKIVELYHVLFYQNILAAAAAAAAAAELTVNAKSRLTGY
jgi:hypothetical protein